MLQLQYLLSKYPVMLDQDPPLSEEEGATRHTIVYAKRIRYRISLFSLHISSQIHTHIEVQ